MIKKIVSLFKNRAFYVTLLIGLFLTSVLIIAAMWLGQESGNFVIRIQNETNERTISLSESEDPTDTSTYVERLTTKGIGNFHDTTLSYFLHSNSEDSDLKELTSNIGVNNDAIETKDENGDVIQSSLYCYTFYIVNTSQSSFYVDVQMTYSGISKNLDEAIRVLTYNGSDINIYQKADDEEIDYVEKYKYYKSAENFVSDKVAYNEQLLLGQGNVSDRNSKYVKYSVLFWLEGYDPDCTDAILGGAIKFELTISVQG